MATVIRLEQMSATEAKNRFGEVLEKAANNRTVSLMRHGKAAAYVIPAALFDVVRQHLKTEQNPLDRLEREFSDLVARMQTPESAAAARGLMTVDTADLQQVVRQRPRRRAARRA